MSGTLQVRESGCAAIAYLLIFALGACSEMPNEADVTSPTSPNIEPTKDFTAYKEAPFPWSVVENSATYLALKAPAEAFGIHGKSNNHDNQRFLSLVIAGPGVLSQEAPFRVYLKRDPVERGVMVEDTAAKTIEGADQFLLAGQSIIVDRGGEFSISCPSPEVELGFPNPFCTALIFPKSTNVVAKLTFPSAGRERITEIILEAKRVTQRHAR